jgi:hypothetical protein
MNGLIKYGATGMHTSTNQGQVGTSSSRKTEAGRREPTSTATKRVAVLVDDNIAVAIGSLKRGQQQGNRVAPDPTDAASHSLLLTTLATNSECDVVANPDKWFGAVTAKLGDLGWNLKQKDITISTSGPALPQSSYLSEVIEQMARILKGTSAEDDGPSIRQAAKSAVGMSNKFAGTDLDTPPSVALCRGVGHVFQGKEGPELALTYAWLQHTTPPPGSKTEAPALEDDCDKGSKLRVLLWRGKLVESSYDHKAVVKILDDQLPNWRNKIVDVLIAQGS